jgi:hypothetical protein
LNGAEQTAGKCFSAALVNAVTLVGGVDNAGNQSDERGRGSTIQRHIAQARLVNDLRQGACGDINLRRVGRDVDSRRRRTDLQGDVDRERLVGFEHDALLCVRFESGCLDRKRIPGRQKSRKYKSAVPACVRGRRGARLYLDGDHTGARDYGAARIADRAADGSVALRAQVGRRKAQAQANDGDDTRQRAE